MCIIGIDYSITSPAICVLHTDSYHWYCFRQKKKHVAKDSRLTMLEYPDYSTPEHRYDDMATLLLDAIIERHGKPSKAFIEDFAFSAPGRITGLAEATGVLKNKLYHMGCQITPIVSSSIKKMATGKGNADKRMMLDAFNKELATDMHSWFDLKDDGKPKVASPVQDCVDSYYVLQYGVANIQQS